MALLGNAALAMWWDMAADVRSDFEDWHAHEHFPERLSVPGFCRASRWASADGGEGVFVMYELDDYAVLSSPPYAARLNSPTPWSTRMMPHHRNMIRSQCRVLESQGAVTARHALTVRLSPAPDGGAQLQQAVRRLGAQLRTRPGLVGLHLIRHETPAMASTEEQKMRGHADRVADWVLIACGYDLGQVRALGDDDLSDAALRTMGAVSGTERQVYALAYSATPADMR